MTWMTLWICELVWHDSLLIHLHTFTWHNSFTFAYVWCNSFTFASSSCAFTCVTWLFTYAFSSAHSYVWYDSFTYASSCCKFICVTWLIHVRLFELHIHTCDITHSDSPLRAGDTSLSLHLPLRAAHSYVWYDSFTFAFSSCTFIRVGRIWSLQCVTVCYSVLQCVTVCYSVCIIWCAELRSLALGLVPASNFVGCDSFICVTWPIQMCDMTHSYGVATVSSVTWLIHMGWLRSVVWHDSFIWGGYGQ